jgi:hypothetical protein
MDEPDILAASPSGDVLVVECTTGIPDDKKLTMLVSRAARLREDLRRSSGSNSADVIPMLVVPLPPEELVGIRAKAQQNSVVILCRPELHAAIERSKFEPDPKAMLQQWRTLAITDILTGNRIAREPYE